MTREELIARLVAIADERPNVSIGHVVEHELPGLRAQAEAMNNGAATNAGRAHVNLGTSGSATEDAAPPSATQPTACLCCGTQTSGVAIQHAECAEAVICASCVEVLRAAPDLAARVEELEVLLRGVETALNSAAGFARVRLAIHAVLEKGEK